MNPSATTPPPSVLEANPHAPVELVQESQVQQPRPSTGEPGLSSRLNSNNHQRRRRVILACENLQTAHEFDNWICCFRRRCHPSMCGERHSLVAVGHYLLD